MTTTDTVDRIENQIILDPGRDRYPLCLVWSPIPLLSWLLPFIGHLGIVTSEGIIHDFAGSYTVNRDPNETAFGSVTKYWPVDLKDIKASGNFNSPIEAWDFAIESSSRAYEKMAHNLFCNNCHDHVARVLNALEFRGRKRWNTFLLIVYMIGYSQFVSFGRWFKTYVGFFGLTILITLFALI